jgi:hypothetical protein
MGTQTASPDRRSHRRFRLATNQNETIVLDDADEDVEGHRLAANDNETVIDGTRDPDEVEDDDSAPGLRRAGRK